MMPRFIDAKMACDEVDKGDLLVGNNADFAKEIIRRTPSADVVPKSESEFDSIPIEVAQVLKDKAVEKAKAEVAREIFEELAREVYSKIPDKILPVTFGEMSRHLDYSDGLNFGSRNAYFDTLKIIAELKKKYTEEKT